MTHWRALSSRDASSGAQSLRPGSLCGIHNAPPLPSGSIHSPAEISSPDDREFWTGYELLGLILGLFMILLGGLYCLCVS